MRCHDLPTPALVIDVAALDHNIDVMAVTRPGTMLRPHVKAHKSTALARYAANRSGSHSVCCATLREARGLIAAGLGQDVMLANETLDPALLRVVAVTAADHDAPLTIAIDSPETLAVAALVVRDVPLRVLVDVNIGLPRCGCAPEAAGALAERARDSGLEVRGVMGYEGHIVGNPDRAWRVEQLAASLDRLRLAHDLVGGDVISSGGTGTYDLHTWATEVQAGSYLLGDTHYARLGLPFRQALTVEATVVSVNTTDGYAVADAGLKAFGMDHGEPEVRGHTTFFCSDEHVTFVAADEGLPAVGSRVRLVPAHIDPTMALHERVFLCAGDEVVDVLEIDLRNW